MDGMRSGSIQGLQGMLGSDPSTLNGVNVLSDKSAGRQTGDSPSSVRAAMQSQWSESSSAESSFISLRSPRASCSPYIETCDMDAPITESLVAATQTATSVLASVAEVTAPESPTPKPRICLSSKDLTDDDAQMIVDLMDAGTVQHLVLAKNRLGNAAAVRIADALKRNKSILFLSLAGNDVGEAGGMALAEALAVNTSLKSLFLSSNALGPTATQALLDANEERSTPLAGLCGLVLGTPVR